MISFPGYQMGTKVTIEGHHDSSYLERVSQKMLAGLTRRPQPRRRGGCRARGDVIETE